MKILVEAVLRRGGQPHTTKATLKNRVVFYFMYTVYILYSQKFHKHYTGFTSDLERRINEHNFLATSGYTIRFRPWTVLHTESFESKEQAMKREKFFKTGVGRELIKKMIAEKYPLDS